MTKKTVSSTAEYKECGRKIFVLFLSLICFQYAFASMGNANDNLSSKQNNVTVKGTVKDQSGEPLSGVSVVVKGTTTGTISNIDGAYTINVSGSNPTLVFSFIGFLPQEVAVNERANIDITLVEDAKALEEVVVVGYGTMRKSDVTGSIATAKGTDIVKAQSFNALDGLKGKAAGVNIFSNTGQPGGEMRVIIRGVSTINASANPLYVVDGVVMSSLQFLNPNDIESIEVLKDASSAAIYGARGANGVILVTTKRGGDTGSSARISYEGSMSIGTMSRYMDMMDADTWMATFEQGLKNANSWQGKNFTTDLSQIFTDERLFNADGSPKYNTDWQKEATRTAVSQNHQLSIQRGNKESSVGAFINYTDQQGILHNTYMKRLNARIAYDDKPTRWLSTGVNLMVNHTWGNRTSDNPYGQGALRTMLEQLPFLPVELDGVYSQTNMVKSTAILNDKDNPASKLQGFGPEGVGNPVELLKRIEAKRYKTQIFGNAALTFHLLPGLDLKTQFGIDYQHNSDKNYTPFTPRPMINQDATGRAEAKSYDTFYWQEETYLTYTKTLDKHHFNAMAGLSWQERNYSLIDVITKGFDDDYLGYYNMSDGKDRPEVPYDNNRVEKWRMNSYFLRGAYSYDGKYMATVTARYDGSSKFGKDNKYAFFPSLGLGWMASNEDFLKDNTVISLLKPHTSIGRTGNSEINPYQSLAILKSQKVIIGDALRLAVVPDRMPNPGLKWETTTQWDFGVDLGLFNNRLKLEASYYYKYTSDLLLDRPIPRSTGFPSVLYNVGEVSNQGIDLLVSAHPIETKDFTWSTNLNLSFNRNRVEKLDESSSVDPISGKRQILKDGFTGYDMLIREGEKLSTFYGYKRAGIYDGIPSNWDEETMNIPDLIGEKVTYKQRQILGNGLPDWMGSFSNTFNYKEFDLTVDLQFTWGVDVMQEFYHSTEARFLTNGLDYLYDNAWHPESNPNGTGQAIRLANFGQGNNANADNTWVANGAYLRANLIQLGYTFNPILLKKMGLSALRVYGSVNNAFLITASDYRGYDPDNSSRLDDNKWGANRQFFTYPRPRTFTIGLNLTF